MRASLFRRLQSASIVMVVALAGCASMLTEKSQIKGRMRLSDSPQAGHGGVLVQAGPFSTVSGTDGKFALEVVYMNGQRVDVTFSKNGYRDTVIGTLVASGSDDSIIDLHDVMLQCRTQTFTDNFGDGNAAGWSEDTRASYSVESGEYSAVAPDDQYQHWSLHEYLPGTGCRFEARTKLVSGRWNAVYGIGIADSANSFTCLFVTRDRHYQVATCQGSSWSVLRDWTWSRAIDTLSGHWNRLRIEKVGTSLTVMINDSTYGGLAAGGMGTANWAGLYVQDDAHVHFDDANGSRP